MRAARLLAIVFAIGCGGGCAPEDAIPLGPSLRSIDANIFRRKCTFACHEGGEYAAGGLDLGDPYLALVGVTATSIECEDEDLVLVAPGDVDGSLLFDKLLAKVDGQDPKCGESMPPSRRPPLSQPEMNAVRDWILLGARDF